MIEWQLFPKSTHASEIILKITAAFENACDQIESTVFNLSSNDVLFRVAPGLREIGFVVEAGKKSDQKILVPVLFGRGGVAEKSFEADGFHPGFGIVLEVEAGRAVVNNQFLKDLFQACMMQDVTTLCIAVRRNYRGLKDFESVCRFFDTLYASDRLQLPLKQILVIGY